MKKVQDHYFHKAKGEGYVARSAYKLQEIDQKHSVFRKGQRVLDLGCSPGSWLQYAAKAVGPQGHITGIDLSPVKLQLPNFVSVFQADIYDKSTEAYLEQPFDVIISDMAPKTTGIRSVDAQRSYDLCEHVVLLADQFLKTDGHLLIKAFQGGAFGQLKQTFQQRYQKVKICKPQSSRKESVEIFLLGQHKKALSLQ